MIRRSAQIARGQISRNSRDLHWSERSRRHEEEHGEIRDLILTIPALMCVAGEVWADPEQNSPAQLQVAVVIVPPYVMQRNGELTGFSIDLWNVLGARMNLKSTYAVFPSARGLDEAMRSGKIDVVASPVVITAARDQDFDFSVPTLQSGLQVMVRDTGQKTQPSSPLEEMIALLFPRTTLLKAGRRAAVGDNSRSHRLVVRAPKEGQYRLKPLVHSGHFRGDVLGSLMPDRAG